MPGNASAIRAGRAYVELFLKDSPLRRGLDRSAARLKAFGGQVRAIGAALAGVGVGVLGGLFGALKVFQSTGEALDKMSLRTGLGVESLAEWGFAAEQAGSDLGTLEKGFAGLSRSLFDAKRGSAEAVDALAAIGLTFHDLEGLSPEEQMEKIADGLASITDESTRGAVAQKLLGRAGRQLLPLLREGSGAIQAKRQEARDAGLTLTKEDTDNAAALDDALGKLRSQLKGVAIQIGAALAKPAKEFLDVASRIMTTVIAWIKENRALVVTVAKIAAIVTAVGTAIVGLGLLFTVIGAAVGGFSLALGAIGAVIGALLSPIGLVVLAVVGLGAAILKYTEVGAEAVGALGRGFSQVKADATEAFGGIRDALTAGDISGAVKILWLTIKLEWARGVAAIQELLLPVKDFISDVFWGAASIANDAWASMESAWTETVAFLSKAWSAFTSFFVQGWNTSLGILKKTWVRFKGLFDESIDVDAELRRIDSETAAANQASLHQFEAELSEAEQRRQAKRRNIERDRQAGELGIGDFAAQARENHRTDIANAARDLQTAVDEWRGAIDEAKEKRRQSTYERELEARANEDNAGEIGQEVRGIFSAADWRKLLGTPGAGGREERIALATEETARNTRNLKGAVIRR